jgi:hypothetical protein
MLELPIDSKGIELVKKLADMPSFISQAYFVSDYQSAAVARGLRDRRLRQLQKRGYQVAVKIRETASGLLVSYILEAALNDGGDIS